MPTRLVRLLASPVLATLSALTVSASLSACAPADPSAPPPAATPAPAPASPPASAPSEAAPATPPAAAPQQPPAATPPSSDKKPESKPGDPSAAKPAAAPIVAVFECESGTFRVELATRQTPRLCANFINLVNRGYYDGQAWVEFSRVVRQTGLNPMGDPAYTLARELSKDLFFDKPGRICYSNTSEDVSTARAKPTRIFITVRPQDRWNLQYAAFGTIVEGLDIAFNLKENEKIIRVRIEGDAAAHQARYAKQIAEWNAALDKVGLIDRR